MKRLVYKILGTVLLPVLLYAQTIVKVPSDLPPDVGHLNTAIQTAINAGTLSKTVFQLDAYGYYVLTGTINVPAGQTLTITAPDPGTTQQTAPPQILWASQGGVNTNYIIDSFGDLNLKNVWILCANDLGDQVGTCIQIEDNPLALNGRNVQCDGVIFDYSPCPPGAGGMITVACTHFRGTFKNCYWRNCIDKHLKYYGRAVSFQFSSTGWKSDSVTFDNCTFANMGYTLMEEGGEYYDYVKFNHCTFLNVLMFPLEYGWWNKLTVTNCIFANTEALGYIPAQTTGEPDPATFRIDSVANFGFVPSPLFGEQDRRILFANSIHFLDQWLVDWMGYGPNGNPYSKNLHLNRRDSEIPLPMPMLNHRTSKFYDSVGVDGKKVFPYMNRAKLDSVNPGFISPPTDTGRMKDFCRRKWDDNSDTNWAWKPTNMTNGVWPLQENLAYTNATVKTAGFGGYPLGDLYHWWPTQYATWKAQSVAENSRIATWLSTGKDPLSSVEMLPGGPIPAEYELSQNYPNPFNPATNIKYSIPLTGHVTLKVYNDLGQEVATLFDGVQQAGNYVATFDGTSLASGVYLYRLQAGNVSISKKLILVK